MALLNQVKFIKIQVKYSNKLFFFKGERCANEILYRLSNASGKSIEVDYEKTYYYQKEQSKKIEELNNDNAISKIKCSVLKVFKMSLILGLSYYVVRKNFDKFNLNFRK